MLNYYVQKNSLIEHNLSNVQGGKSKFFLNSKIFMRTGTLNTEEGKQVKNKIIPRP